MARLLSVLAMSLLLAIGACSSDGPTVRSSASAVTTTIDTATVTTDNPFLPDPERNITDCLSALERPDCGSDAKGGIGQLLAFGALVLGLTVIGWRVVVAVRRNDRARHG